MNWTSLSLLDLYYYYLDNGWLGSAALIAQQGKEIVKIKEKKEEKIKSIIGIDVKTGKFVLSDTSRMGLWKGEQ